MKVFYEPVTISYFKEIESLMKYQGWHKMIVSESKIKANTIIIKTCIYAFSMN